MDHDQGVDVTLSSYSGPAGRNSLYLHIELQLNFGTIVLIQWMCYITTEVTEHDDHDRLGSLDVYNNS